MTYNRGVHNPLPLTCSSRARLLTVAALLSVALAAGCGGGSRARTTSVPGDAGATTARTRVPAPGAQASPALAFARCMRASGVPNFPDPSSGGGGRFQVPAGTSPTAPAFRTAQAKCQKLLGGGGLPGSGPPASKQTLTKLLRIARCMRQHGVSQFPDPLASLPSRSNLGGAGVITDYDGAILVFPATLNLQAPAYRQALTACGAPPLGLPH